MKLKQSQSPWQGQRSLFFFETDLKSIPQIKAEPLNLIDTSLPG